MPGARDSYFTTSSGKSLKGEYTEDDLSDWNPAESLGRAGDPPFTRGNHASGYRGRLWTMRQYAGYATAAESNRRYRYLLEQGQSGLSVAFDLPTQIGYDSDHAMARGEVGRVGVAIDSLDDMETLFDGISLDKVSTSMTINSTASILLALYVAVGRRQGVADENLSGTVQNDILKEYMARGTYIYPPGPSMRIATDVISFCQDTLPRFNPISISGYHIREAGATAAQELAFTLANGLAYVEAAVTAGLDVDEFGARLSFFFNSHRNFLEEIAKFRAARRLWGKLLRERYRSRNPHAQMLRFHTKEIANGARWNFGREHRCDAFQQRLPDKRGQKKVILKGIADEEGVMKETRHEFYDLTVDPHEQHSTFREGDAAIADTVQALHEKMEQPHAESLSVELDEETIRQLQALGYSVSEPQPQ